MELGAEGPDAALLGEQLADIAAQGSWRILRPRSWSSSVASACCRTCPKTPSRGWGSTAAKTYA